LLRFGEPAWRGGHGESWVIGSEFLLEGLKREVGGNTMYNHLHNWCVEVEGDSSRNNVEVLPHSGVKPRGEEVFQQGDGHIASASTSRATRNLNGEDGHSAGCGAESLVQVISKLHGGFGEF
jgi:hypothetical protein